MPYRSRLLGWPHVRYSPIGQTYRLQSKATSYELVGSSHHEGENDSILAGLEGNHTSFLAHWILEAADIGHRLRHADTGRMLDSNTERQVYLLGSNDGSFQKWRINPGAEGYFTLVNLATGFALDGNAEGDVYTTGPNDGAYQRWKFIPA